MGWVIIQALGVTIYFIASLVLLANGRFVLSLVALVLAMVATLPTHSKEKVKGK